MTTVTCPSPGCGEVITEDDGAVRAVLLQHHLQVAHPLPSRPRPPQLPTPKIEGQVTVERFEEFSREWTQFKHSTGLEQDKVVTFLVNCCASDLRTDIQSAVPGLTAKPEAEVLATIRLHAVLSRAKCSLMTDLLSARQDEAEPVRKFYARINQSARSCDLAVQCPEIGCARHAKPYVDYTDQIVKHVILNGLYDVEIRRDVLSTAGLDDKSLTDTIALIEDKETAARSVAGSGTQAAGQSSYRQQKKIAPGDKRLTATGKCESCQAVFRAGTRMTS